MELTPEEHWLIENIRGLKMAHGKIILTIYIHHGKICRIEPEMKVVSSLMIRNLEGKAIKG